MAGRAPSALVIAGAIGLIGTVVLARTVDARYAM
jgi:hypothetical protein